MTRIYMDHHATTPVDPRVVAAMNPYWSERPGNASSQHLFGWEAREAVEDAAAHVAEAVGVHPREVVFTSGATESNNLALRGCLEMYRDRGRHLVTTAIEHPAVLDVAAQLEREGVEVTRVPVDASGIVDPDAVAAALRDDTVLCSVMWANNEIGTIQPVAEIAARCRQRGVLMHTDAAQAVGRVPLEADASGVDLMSISAHKFYGPKGVGVLTARRRKPRVRLVPLLHGGGHQRGRRSGTLAVPLIVGMGEAIRLAQEEGPREACHLHGLRTRLLERLQAQLEGLAVNGDMERRLPHNLNVRFRGVEASAVLLELPHIALSTGSACATEQELPSHVLRALGLGEEEAHASLRFGLGRWTTEQEVDEAADAVARVVLHLRRTSPLYGGN